MGRSLGYEVPNSPGNPNPRGWGDGAGPEFNALADTPDDLARDDPYSPIGQSGTIRSRTLNDGSEVWEGMAAFYYGDWNYVDGDGITQKNPRYAADG